MDNIGFIGDINIGTGCLSAYFDYFAENFRNQGGVVVVSPRTMSLVEKSVTPPMLCVLKPFKMPDFDIDKKKYLSKRKRILKRHRMF